jgi:hypothetical protein
MVAFGFLDDVNIDDCRLDRLATPMKVRERSASCMALRLLSCSGPACCPWTESAGKSAGDEQGNQGRKGQWIGIYVEQACLVHLI